MNAIRSPRRPLRSRRAGSGVRRTSGSFPPGIRGMGATRSSRCLRRRMRPSRRPCLPPSRRNRRLARASGLAEQRPQNRLPDLACRLRFRRRLRWSPAKRPRKATTRLRKSAKRPRISPMTPRRSRQQHRRSQTSPRRSRQQHRRSQTSPRRSRQQHRRSQTSPPRSKLQHRPPPRSPRRSRSRHRSPPVGLPRPSVYRCRRGTSRRSPKRGFGGPSRSPPSPRRYRPFQVSLRSPRKLRRPSPVPTPRWSRRQRRPQEMKHSTYPWASPHPRRASKPPPPSRTSGLLREVNPPGARRGAPAGKLPLRHPPAPRPHRHPPAPRPHRRPPVPSQPRYPRALNQLRYPRALNQLRYPRALNQPRYPPALSPHWHPPAPSPHRRPSAPNQRRPPAPSLPRPPWCPSWSPARRSRQERPRAPGSRARHDRSRARPPTARPKRRRSWWILFVFTSAGCSRR